ncbi:MAG TPA: TlpA disulfide reductase family protein, partial [Acidobacteriota bacterium]|nr:TlpA disulfide reductase family protein [Acidobacteriota bacterium]
MKAKKIALGFVIICLALTFSSCKHPSYHSGPLVQIGAVAPNFSLPDMNGREISLDQFRGKVVMLDFWASWCGPCRMTMPVIERLEREYADIMVTLAVNLNEPWETVHAYVKRNDIHSQVLLDELGRIGQRYGVHGIPVNFIIDREGIVRHIQEGFDPGMESRLRREIDKL